MAVARLWSVWVRTATFGDGMLPAGMKSSVKRGLAAVGWVVCDQWRFWPQTPLSSGGTPGR